MFQMSSDEELTELIKEYQHKDGVLLDKSYDYSKNRSSLEEAIELAFKSEDERGRVHPHQRRIGRKNLIEAAKVASEHLNYLSDFDDSTPFKDIYSFVEKIANHKKVIRIGQLARYDIALRIAVHFEIKVDEVYCHAGTTKGAKALGIDVRNGDTLHPRYFPTPLRHLSADHIENFLCIYKDRLRGINRTNSCC